MAVFGLDIGGTKIETAIFNNDIEQQQSWRIATPTDSYQELLQAICQQVCKADEICGCQGAVGIGMPGLVNEDGAVFSANVPCASGNNIAKDLEVLLQRPVAILNDTRCFALSEANGGAGQGYERVFGAILGTGAGGGMCINGELLNQGLGLSGEYGHLPLSAYLQQKYQLPILKCGCGLTGCVESYIAGPGVQVLNQHLSGETRSCIEWAQALKRQDKGALKVLACHLDILGETFAAITKSLHPEVIVLGGGLSLVDALVEQLPGAIATHLFAGFKVPHVKRAHFGDSSGVRGAAIIGSVNAQAE
ncbi:ROK family protein [Pseudoalteromonas sp. T1lg75]|uniref:ROK family protein n=1 Tax=Pseudoalteromonas sp. T1lg75 TaxID=2077102 RepID=UPI000CF6B097|nr:ROK family protein [Pseudoalteromonas sp. T1lg75]